MSFEKKIADKFRPIVYLHPDEEYYPSTIEWYMNKCELWKNNTLIKKIGELTPDNIPNNSESHEMDLHVKKEARAGSSLFQLNNVPAYTHVSKIENGDLQITYCYFYPYNGPVWLFGIPDLFKKCDIFQVGSHQADIEHITIIVDESLNIKKMYCSAHGSKDGLWVKPYEIEYENDRPVVYSSKNSHAFYPFPKTICRCIGLTNDYARRGIKWDPPLKMIDDNTHWNTFQGYLGKNKVVPTPKYRPWWIKESDVSTTWWRRVFCICM